MTVRRAQSVLLLVLAWLAPACGGGGGGGGGAGGGATSPPGAFALVGPADGSGGLSVLPTFSWTVSSQAASYRLEVSLTSNFATVIWEETGLLGVTGTLSVGFTHATTFFWRVIAVNSLGAMTASNAPFSLTTGAGPGGPPGAFTQVAPADGALGVSRIPTFRWNPSSGATSYTLDVATDLGFTMNLTTKTGIKVTGTVSPSALRANTDYFWRVTAVNGSGSVGAAGSPDTFRTNGPPGGGLDATFGGVGAVATAVGTADATAFAVAAQPDGRLVVAGRAFNGTDDDFALVRYNLDGTLDNTFGTGGIVMTPIGSAADAALCVALQSDGKIVAAGYSFNGVKFDAAVVRYNPDGTLDAGFSGDGIVTTDVTGGADLAKGIVIQPAGEVVIAAGSRLARYTSGGVLDTTFDTDGISVVTPYTFSSLARQSDGKLVAAGSGTSSLGTNSDVSIARFNANGTLDTAFDTDGLVQVPVEVTRDDFGMAVAIQAGAPEKIVVAGWVRGPSGFDEDFAAARLNLNGSLDTTFDTDGMAVTPIDIREDEANAVAIQGDGGIVLAGVATQTNTNQDFGLVRYTTAGALDASFDTDGKVRVAIGSGNDVAFGMTLMPDGRIVAAGSSSIGGFLRFAVLRLLP